VSVTITPSQLLSLIVGVTVLSWARLEINFTVSVTVRLIVIVTLSLIFILRVSYT